MQTPTATSSLRTFEILVSLTGSVATAERTTLRTTRDGLVKHLRSSMPDASLVKRGYTTWRLYSGGKCVGSVQELCS